MFGVVQVSQAVYCPQCPDQVFSDKNFGGTEVVSKIRELKKNFVIGVLELTSSIVSYAVFGKDIAILRILEDLANDAFERMDRGESVEINKTTFRHVVAVLMLLPKNIPLPMIELEDSGDITLEWYRDKWNLFTIIIDESGYIYYAGLFGSKNDRDSGKKPIGYEIDSRITQLIGKVVNAS